MFTCLDCRAVHLEVTASMDLDSFLIVFSRFVDRRTLPRICYSDNGTNLVAGEQEIREAQANWNTETLMTKMANRDVEWRFSPPAAPHFGGSWERLIKSAKSVLKGILHERSVSDEVLVTAMTGVEALLNGRPLTHVTTDPNHFIHGRSNPTLHLDHDVSVPISDKRRWLHVQTIFSHFWSRWLKEYVPNLIERRKWLRPRRNIQVDDIVIVVTPNAKRGTWPIGRVIHVITGQDQVVRSAEVKIIRVLLSRSNKKNVSDPPISVTTLVRPVHKLCLIELGDSSDVFMDENRAGNVRND